jgi:precorrin-6B methylase 2
LEGAKILELGAGTAALGISLSAWCEISLAILTDLEEVIPLISRNVAVMCASNNKIRDMVTEKNIKVIPYTW